MGQVEMALSVLSVGNQLTIYRDIEDAQIHHWTTLLGWKARQFLIIDMPKNDHNAFEAREGTVCLVRYEGPSKLFGFETMILKVSQYPGPLIYLKYPQIIKEMSLRRHKRIKTSIQAWIYNVVGNQAVILDISEGGCLLSSETYYDVGSSFYISFDLPNGDRVEYCRCWVRHVRRENGEILIGVEFEEVKKSLIKKDSCRN